MMPLWLQLTAAICAAAASALMGIAFVPFLQKIRFYEPEKSKEQAEEAVGERRRPTMCGLLAVFGCLFSLALSFSLYCTFCKPDRTSADFREITVSLLCGLFWCLICAFTGFLLDRRRIRRPVPQMGLLKRLVIIFIGLLIFLLLWNTLSGTTQPALMDFGFRHLEIGWLFYPLTAAAGSVCQLSAADMEEETDGMSLTSAGVLLLGMTVLLLQEAQEILALWTLTAAGGCVGSLIWNLRPNGCRLGMTGSLWLAGTVTMVCIVSRLHTALLLICAVYLLDRIPAVFGEKASLQKRMKLAGMNEWQRIAVNSAFAAFSAVIAVFAYR